MDPHGETLVAFHATQHAITPTTVRRLTPLECERLQGLPDGYTAIDGASDSARYAAIGNAMAVPVMEWIARRIEAAEATRRPAPG